MAYQNYNGMYAYPEDEGIYDINQNLNPYSINQTQQTAQAQNGMTGSGMGMMGGGGQFNNFNRAMSTPLGRMGTNAIMGMMNGQNFGQAATGAAMDFGKSALMKYGTKQLLGGALGGQAAGFLGGPWGMAAMAAAPMISKGLSSLGRSLGIGGRKHGPSAQEVAMGEAKGNLAGMRGTYGADMAAGQALRDKYNPMLENQIGRMQELADRGLSTEYNTRQMAGAAANTEAARRAAEARMKATSGMMGGGQALSGFGGINQAAIGAQAQGGYQAAMNNMNSQPGYIQALAGMAGSQIGRGDNYYNQGRSGMMGLDQSLYNLNAQEKARADALSQANRDREANMIGGVMNMAGTAMGMEQARRSNNDYLTALGLRGNAGSTGLSADDFAGKPGFGGATDSAGIARELMQDEAYQGFNPQKPQINDYAYPAWQMQYIPHQGGPRMGNMQLAQGDINTPEQDELEWDYSPYNPKNFAGTGSRFKNPGQYFDPQQFGRDFTGR